MDTLSDVLSHLKVKNITSATLEAGRDWALSFTACPYIQFVALLRGVCWLTVDGVKEPIPLQPGDCYMLVQSASYCLSSGLGLSAVDFAPLFKACKDRVVRYHGDDCLLVSGRFSFDSLNARLLMDSLPTVSHLPATADAASNMRTVLKLLVEEMSIERSGSSLVAERLSQILLVHALRAHAVTASPHTVGWLQGLADPKVAAALRLLHGQVRRNWTVALLASEVGMSRSAFALRFKTIVGQAPLEYLLRWRMHLAAKALRINGNTVASVAGDMGYQSESSFSMAFKRVMKESPKRYIELESGSHLLS